MKCNKNCPKCNRPIFNLWHFHEADHLGVQAVIHHNKKTVIDLFGNEHESFTDDCFLTEIEYQTLIK